MNTIIDKLIRAKELILEAEQQFIDENRLCPYEIGFTLRKLDEAINQITAEENKN